MLADIENNLIKIWKNSLRGKTSSWNERALALQVNLNPLHLPQMHLSVLKPAID